MALHPEIKQIKIHPAIGFARMSTNVDYYVFDPDNPIRTRYKSDSKIMRQAVQYRLFAYGENNVGLYELTPALLRHMGLTARWHADVCNRKIEELTGDPSDRFRAASETTTNDIELIGTLGTFSGGVSIRMGTLTTEGLFVPPVSEVHRRTPETEIRATGMHDPNVSDNSSDGAIGARLFDDESGDSVDVDILPAWVCVCPPDFAPDADDIGQNNLLLNLQRLLDTPDQAVTQPVNLQARTIDQSMLRRGTASFQPGIEMSGPFRKRQFFPATVTNDPDEIRILPEGQNVGVSPVR